MRRLALLLLAAAGTAGTKPGWWVRRPPTRSLG
jgi:hypothetical protein